MQVYKSRGGIARTIDRSTDFKSTPEVGNKTESKIEWSKSIPFFLMHILCVAVLWIPFQWNLLALCVASYYFRMFAITAGYHRLFSHRSYRVGRFTQFILAWIGTTAVQKGVLWWAANHRFHHRHSDLPKDIHSPTQHGFWWSHVLWILSDKHEETQWELIQDLVKYPELRWLNKYYHIPAALYGLTFLVLGGWSGFIWGFVLSTVLLWHGTFTINSLSHVFGSRRYATSDTSKNSFWLALLTLGEGWHNNHHCYMSSANQGFFWWEIDGSYYALKALSWLGLVSDLRKPPLHLLEAKRIKQSREEPRTSPIGLESSFYL